MEYWHVHTRSAHDLIRKTYDRLCEVTLGSWLGMCKCEQSDIKVDHGTSNMENVLAMHLVRIKR